MALAKYVISFEKVRDHIGFSEQAAYIFKYAKGLGARTAIIEEHYVDKDYIIDYSGFYARSFEKIDKCTTRVHFFSNRFSKKVFENILEQGNDGNMNKLGDYLGFTIVKRRRRTPLQAGGACEAPPHEVDTKSI